MMNTSEKTNSNVLSISNDPYIRNQIEIFSMIPVLFASVHMHLNVIFIGITYKYMHTRVMLINKMNEDVYKYVENKSKSGQRQMKHDTLWV